MTSTASIVSVLFVLVMVALLVVAVGGLVWLLIRHGQNVRQRQQQQWAYIAQQLGLTFKPGDSGRADMIEGDAGGAWVRIDTYTVNSDNSSTTYTRVRTYHHPTLNLGLEVYREGAFTGLGKFLGVVRDIETGDATFDNVYVIKGHDEAQVLRLLTTGVRQQMYAYEHAVGHVKLDDTCITFSFTGRMDQAAQVQYIIANQLALITAMRRAQHGVDAPSAVAEQSWAQVGA